MGSNSTRSWNNYWNNKGDDLFKIDFPTNGTIYIVTDSLDFIQYPPPNCNLYPSYISGNFRKPLKLRLLFLSNRNLLLSPISSWIPPNAWINFYSYYHCGLFFFVHYYIIVAALSAFPNLSNQSDTSEIYYNRKEDIAEYCNKTIQFLLQYPLPNIVVIAR